MDTVYTIHLRSYGFLHPGRERLLTRAFKRAWDFIPGSTLHGALAAALVRLDGVDAEEAQPLEGTGDFHVLLKLVFEKEIRFTPLVPGHKSLNSAIDYCEAARQHAATATLFQATPHAPISRATEVIHGDRLFAYAVHRPVVDYHGFIFAPAGAEKLLRRGLRLLPFIPFGGKGKFSAVEAWLQQRGTVADFKHNLRNNLVGGGYDCLQLMTPMLLQSGSNDWLLQEAAETIVSRVQRYRIWQSGFAYDPNNLENPFGPHGVDHFPEDSNDVTAYPGGQESVPVTGLPAGSRFRLHPQGDNIDRMADAFVEGVGHPGWRYAGWGQIVFRRWKNG